MKYRWRKAMVVSAFLHLILWGVAGVVSGQWQTAVAPREEQIIEEVELVGVPDGSDEVPSVPENVSLARPEPLPPEMQPVPEPEPVPVTNDPEEAVTEEVAPAPVAEEVKDEPNPDMAAATANTGQSLPRMMNTPPVLITDVYPAPAEQAKVRFKGKVSLRMWIMETGRVGKIDVAVTSGSKRVDDIAIAAAKQWLFKAATDFEGKPMPVMKIVQIPFNQK